MRRIEPPAIAFLWESRSLTGGQRRLLAIAQYMNDRGHRAFVLLRESDAEALRRVSGEQFSVVLTYKLPWWVSIWLKGSTRFPLIWPRLGLQRCYLIMARVFWKRLLTSLGVGLCHVSMSATLARVIPGPALFEVTSPDWADRLVSEPETVPSHILLHAVSESVYYRLEAGLPDRRIVCAPLPFPNLDPALSHYPDMSAKERLIVFAHRLVPRKNGVLFARVAKRFLADNPNWRIAIRGEGPDEAEIREVLLAEISAGLVELGYVPNLPAELCRARIFVSIIEPDNYPSQSVIEAMLCGNALLLSDQGLTREKFYGNNGVLTELNEASVFFSLVSLTSDLNELDRMGRRSLSIVKNKYSREKYIEHLKSVYKKAGFGALGYY